MRDNIPSRLDAARELEGQSFAGAPEGADYVDDTGTAARLFATGHLLGDRQTVYFTDGQRIRQFNLASGNVTMFAGADEFDFVGGVATAAPFQIALASLARGSILFVADKDNSAIRSLEFTLALNMVDVLP